MCGAGLLIAQICSSFMAQPDYLGYTNILAGNKPQRVLVGSDLDWGQDLLRLRDRLAQLHVKELALGYSGSADPATLGLPPFHPVPTKPAPGWIAVSMTWRKLESHPIGQSATPYDWLDSFTAKEQVGSSYLLYNIPASAVPGR